MASEAVEIQEEIINLRRGFHENPELSFEVRETGRTCASYCQSLGLAVKRCCAELPGKDKYGVIATIRPDLEGKSIALRAEMDALPIQEQTELSFCSRKQNIAHLCGHDAHCAMLLGAARILSNHKDAFKRPVQLIFQPSEETLSGAKKVVDEGFLANVGEIYGLHVHPRLKIGKLGWRSDALMASPDELSIIITGKGGHAAMPHLCVDPIPIAAEIILSLQTLISRKTDPLDSAVISICMLKASDAVNVIPEKAELQGTIRSFSATVRDFLHREITNMAGFIAKAHGAVAKVDIIKGSPVLTNDSERAKELSEIFNALCDTKVFKSLNGGAIQMAPIMGSEDFSYYLEQVKGAFAFLGAGDGREDAPGFHSSSFMLDERALPLGSALLAAVALTRASC
ncbi:MAG: hypothetical protein A2V65_10205 [Deltaproteobacteria bacterium RBG_13_49_15]|nr:MAG: hypothetical protein A2V65_10205 [Deltaproteobacteria bacterium RBG_13_49_15]